MIFRRIFAALSLLCILVAPAQAQKSKATLTTEVNTNWPDNTNFQITPGLLRSTVLDIINSYVDINGSASFACPSHQWIQSIPTLSSFTCTQPAASDLSNGTTGTGAIVLATSPTLTQIITPTIFGGTSAGSTLTLQSTSNGSPSGDSASVFGSTVTIGASLNVASIVNLGGTAGGGITVNIANSNNGLLALNVFNASGGKQIWIPGAGAGTTPGAITFPAATDTVAVLALAQTLTNKTINGGSNTFCLPNRQVLITGTNLTYTTPTCSSVLPTRIELEMVGGGGGGSGSGTTPTGQAAGGNTCWNTSSPACTTPLYAANGGALGSATAANIAAGGTSSGCDLNLSGGVGGVTAGATANPGGWGGHSAFGGAGQGATVASSSGAVAGSAASANTGSGGGGASSGTVANAGGGGGAGGYCRKLFTSPASSYFYTVGAAGTAGNAGTSGAAGGTGGSGLIIATAYWQ